VIIVRNGLYIGDKNFIQTKINSLDIIVESFLESYYTEKPCSLIFIDYKLSQEFLLYAKNIMKINLSSSFIGRINDLRQMGCINLQKIIENKQIDNIYIDATNKLASLLGVDLVRRIECYDTSHNHGISAVASMVVFNDGRIDHKLYRKFNLSDDINGNDLLALETVLRRRLSNTELAIPDIILVDGGQLQLRVAKNLIGELGFHDKINIIAIYKGERRTPELDKVIINSDLELSFREEPNIFRLLQVLRDEAHRFAITGHRKKQVDRMSYSRLEDIPGIGAKKRKALIAFFGSANNVALASIGDLLQVDGVGHELATSIYKFFNN
jgi:excinuclease ABC subunit C